MRRLFDSQLNHWSGAGGELRKFGLMRRHYLKEHGSGIYQCMVLSGTLKVHLLSVQEQAEERVGVLIETMAKAGGVMEQLKVTNQMLEVRRMNNIRDGAVEIVREEFFIFVRTGSRAIFSYYIRII